MTATLARPPAPAGGSTIEHAVPAPPRGRLQRVVRGPVDDPAWARPALLGLLALATLLYTWNLAASGYANSFYAAAVQSGTQSWKAWFFGALDSGNSITVDKPPASLWIMGLSARIFGFNSWSLLLPQALEGVASVALLYGAVRRAAGHGAGLFAGAALGLTPAAVLMFRFDNPDALLTLLLIAGAYAVTRAVEVASWRWLALAGAALGFAFLTKMLQGLLVLPAFALVYLIAAPAPMRRRILHAAVAGLSMLVSAGWWLVAVALWPASSRPYIGGSTNNTVLDLVFGYNGFGRLFGSGAGNGGGNGGGGSAQSGFGGATGITRMFTSEIGNEISWLLPASLVALVLGVVLTRRAPRIDRTRAALVLWGGWLLVTALVFSYMKGTMHPYYTVALAPAVAATLAIGGALAWRARSTTAGRVGMAALIAAAGGWSYVLLGRASTWHPELRYLELALTTLAAVAALAPPARLGRVVRGVVVAGLAAVLLGVGAFGMSTAAAAHTGSIPTVGPVTAQSSGGGMGGGAGATMSGGRPSGTPPTGSTGSTGSNAGSTGAASGTAPTRSNGSSSSARSGMGGGVTTSSALVAALKSTTSTWAAAVSGDQTAAELELASGKAVIAIGGWSGSDNSPTLAQFKAYVAAGKVRYYLGGTTGGQGGQGGSGGVASAISTWVAAHYTAKTIGGQTVYDLSSTK